MICSKGKEHNYHIISVIFSKRKNSLSVFFLAVSQCRTFKTPTLDKLIDFLKRNLLFYMCEITSFFHYFMFVTFNI